ncbi:MAG: hypothetical protein L0Z46_04070 [Nitrospiraceae bacterium]|nr:hypothetical protein [Nitrospiraceae bacterium]
MREIAAIVEVLSGRASARGKTSRRSSPSSAQESRARIPETTFPAPYLLTATENTIIDGILELFNKHGLTSHQSMNLLERLGGIIEMEKRVAKGATH